uniref:Uncharacterized protein n=1 Tax=uncultured gamma proteobacterium EB000_65A11 TaxID=710972 RepID=E0Y018_9GAMM|nr:hypothetical protein [uncultured gamma proteobacterium EB000_65A11]
MLERFTLAANRSKYACCYSTLQKNLLGSTLDEQPKVHFNYRYLDDCITVRGQWDSRSPGLLHLDR